MATAHTYYIAYRDRCLGERASNDALATMLKDLWRARAGEADPTAVDGTSAWLDDAGAVQVRLVRNATAEVVTDADFAARALPHLRG
jgi:hypothetical protein